MFGLILRQRPTGAFGNFIFDVADNPARDRISVFVDEHDRLHLDVIDSLGKRHSASGVLKESDFGTPHVFTFTVQIVDGVCSLLIDVDNGCRANVAFEGVPLAISKSYVLGSDITGGAPSWMCVASFAVFDHALSSAEKVAAIAWTDEQHLKRPCENGSGSWIVFNGRQSLRSTNHPHPSVPSWAPRKEPCPYVDTVASNSVRESSTT